MTAFGLLSHPAVIHVLFPTTAVPPPPSTIEAQPFTINQIIRACSGMNNVDPAFTRSIIAAESAFQPNLVSPKGAIGLMQLMPETAAELGADPHDPAQNVEAGTHYLSQLMARYHKCRDRLTRTIAAYNAGPGSVDRYRGIPPFHETRNYVKRVLAFYRVYSASSVRANS